MSPVPFDTFKLDEIWTQMLQINAKTVELAGEIKKLTLISLCLGITSTVLSLVVFIVTLVRL